MKVANRVLPLVSRARLRLGYPNDFKLAATRFWDIAPSMTTTSPRAIFDEADLSKITGVYEDSSLAVEMARVSGCEITHGATTVYEFKDVLLANGHLFSAKMSLDIGWRRAPVFVAGHVEEHDHAAMASTRLGLRFFGHWMHDDLPLLLAARNLSKPISLLAAPTPAQKQYLEMLNLKSEVVCNDAFFRHLLIVDDVGQNDYKRGRYLDMRRLVMRAAGTTKPPGVMILRGTSGQDRSLKNEQDVADLLKARGWLVLDPSVHSAAQMVEACSDVPMVLGVEGSQLCNGLMWMAQGGTLVVVMPPQRFVTILKNQCDNLGIHYAFVVADPTDRAGFRLNLVALERLLDRVASGDASKRLS